MDLITARHMDNKIITLDAFMAQLGEDGGDDNKEAVANGLLKVAESVARRAKKEYGLDVDDAQYVLKDVAEKIDKKGLSDATGKGRFVQSYISTIAKDRDAEAILPESVILDDYRILPVVLRSHLYGEQGLGRNDWIVPNDRSSTDLMYSLLAKTIFASVKANPIAEQVYQWIVEDMPIGDSIGFIPVEWVEPADEGWGKVYDGWVKRVTAFLKTKGREATEDLLEGLKRIYTKIIMLEYSKVMIPSNPFAVAIAVEKGLLLESEVDKYTLKDNHIEQIGCVVSKPFPNQHACRLRNPDDFQDGSFRTTTRESDGKEYSIISGRLTGETTMTEQAFRYDKDVWTTSAARTHCNEHDGSFEAASEKEETVSSSQFSVVRDELSAGFAENLPTENSKLSIWNKSLEGVEGFDITEVSGELDFDNDIYTKFLGCAVKNIYVNKYAIPSPLMGTYLSSIQAVTSKLIMKDTRRFSSSGKESPPKRSLIQLNSTRSGRFLVDGTEFCHTDTGIPLIKDFYPTWNGLSFSIIVDEVNEEAANELMYEVHRHADSNHMLKGEKFALSGEFLNTTDDDWNGLIIDAKDKQAIRKSLQITSEDGKSRGLLFVGPPGTGKTKAGRTIMNDTDNTFIWMSARDFMCGWPTSIIALAFDMARKLSPTVLFMEDIDHDLDTDLIKTELDGLRQNSGIMTVLTTNFPERLPEALIDRPGRFHHVIHFGLPDDAQRKQMLQLWSPDMDPDILDEIVKATAGFSGAHIKELIDYADTIAEDEGMTPGQALVESMMRMSAQRELVASLRSGKKSFINPGILARSYRDDYDDITPEMAALLLEIDDEQKAEAEEDVTVDQLIAYAKGKPI